MLLLQRVQRGDDAFKRGVHFKEGRLFIIERVEQAEDDGNGPVLAPEKRRKALGDGRFHLVTGECPRNIDALKQFLGRDGSSPFRNAAGKFGDVVNVQPVGAVHHGHRNAFQQGMRSRIQRDPEDIGRSI